jgi:transcriptional regulator with XRE-family HTH domain
VDKLLFQKKIGQRIKTLRKEQKLSQRQLSFLCNKDPQSLERVENGKSCATVYYLKEVCDALQVNMEEFFKEVK